MKTQTCHPVNRAEILHGPLSDVICMTWIGNWTHGNGGDDRRMQLQCRIERAAAPTTGAWTLQIKAIIKSSLASKFRQMKQTFLTAGSAARADRLPFSHRLFAATNEI
jgi:hypothetical protein